MIDERDNAVEQVKDAVDVLAQIIDPQESSSTESDDTQEQLGTPKPILENQNTLDMLLKTWGNMKAEFVTKLLRLTVQKKIEKQRRAEDKVLRSKEAELRKRKRKCSCLGR